MTGKTTRHRDAARRVSERAFDGAISFAAKPSYHAHGTRGDNAGAFARRLCRNLCRTDTPTRKRTCGNTKVFLAT